jgi:cytosine/adenosine deaminase-related metal-dependent hydrolase
VLFRNAADGLPLLGWLQQRIWPFEAAHTPESLRASADLGLAELLLSGTTSILDMGTVHHTDALFEAAAASGIRYTGGKAMMDTGEGVPAGLRETTDDSIGESLSLARRHHHSYDGRLRYAFCPRFVLSCTRDLLHEVAELSAREGLLVHTHASENVDELAAVRKVTGRDNVAYFAELGLSGDRLVMAHCVHLNPAEVELVARTRASVVHCPGSNLKLASGIARLPELLRAGVNVGIGADGAPCNNTLDVFHELRLAATLHLPAFGADSLPPREVLALATRHGAKALGLEDEIGQLREGFNADVTVVDLSAPHFHPRGEDLAGAVVYSANGTDVRDVFVGGRQLVERRKLKTLNLERVREKAGSEAKKLFARARREARA